MNHLLKAQEGTITRLIKLGRTGRTARTARIIQYNTSKIYNEHEYMSKCSCINLGQYVDRGGGLSL